MPARKIPTEECKNLSSFLSFFPFFKPAEIGLIESSIKILPSLRIRIIQKEMIRKRGRMKE